jgi:hypothetical protein
LAEFLNLLPPHRNSVVQKCCGAVDARFRTARRPAAVVSVVHNLPDTSWRRIFDAATDKFQEAGRLLLLPGGLGLEVFYRLKKIKIKEMRPTIYIRYQ